MKTMIFNILTSLVILTQIQLDNEIISAISVAITAIINMIISLAEQKKKDKLSAALREANNKIVRTWYNESSVNNNK